MRPPKAHKTGLARPAPCPTPPMHTEQDTNLVRVLVDQVKRNQKEAEELRARLKALGSERDCEVEGLRQRVLSLESEVRHKSIESQRGHKLAICNAIRLELAGLPSGDGEPAQALDRLLRRCIEIAKANTELSGRVFELENGGRGPATREHCQLPGYYTEYVGSLESSLQVLVDEARVRECAVGERERALQQDVAQEAERCRLASESMRRQVVAECKRSERLHLERDDARLLAEQLLSWIDSRPGSGGHDVPAHFRGAVVSWSRSPRGGST